MHWEQAQFVKTVREAFPEYFKSVSVLEIGSYNVNGSVRGLIDATRYVGVDLIAGPGVDLVCFGHEFRSGDRFDVVVSTECFEHDPHYVETFRNMIVHTRDGGIVIFTCASEGRPEHGTSRSDPVSSPGTIAVGSEYYRNLTERDFENFPFGELFSSHRFFRNATSHDLYFVGKKLGAQGSNRGKLADESARLEKIASGCIAIERISSEIEASLNLPRTPEAIDALKRMDSLLASSDPLYFDFILSRKAALLIAVDRAVEAESIVRKALAVSDFAELHWQLACSLHRQGRTIEAEESARQAVTRAPNCSQFNCFLGTMLQLQNKLDSAEAVLRQAISIDKRNADAYVQFSIVRMKQARFDEALTAAETACKLSPGLKRVHDHLLNLRARLQAGKTPPGIVQHGSIATRAVNQPTPVISGRAPRHPLFVVGSPRSGTSILVSALLAAGYSGFFEGNFLSMIDPLDRLIDRHFATFADGNPKVLISILDKSKLKRELFGVLCVMSTAVNPAPPWLDKTASAEMIMAIPALREFWPDSAFIFAKRRAIENLLSRSRKFSKHNFKYHCTDWAKTMSNWRKIRAELPSEAFIEVDQQAIIRTPHQVAEVISQFLSLGPENTAKLTNVFQSKRPQQTFEGSAARVATLASTGWSEEKTSTFLGICGPEMEAFGYCLDEEYSTGDP